MSQRDAKLLWLRDILDHLSSCRRQIEWAENADAAEVLLETMIRDLDCCRRLCESLQRQDHKVAV